MGDAADDAYAAATRDVDTVEIVCEHVAMTEKAILVRDGDRHIWLPLSLIEITKRRGKIVTIEMTEGLAAEKDLI